MNADGNLTPVNEGSADRERIRQALQTWLPARIDRAQFLHVSRVQRPGGNGVSNETLIVDADWQVDGRRTAGSFVVRLRSPYTLYPEIGVDLQYRMYKIFEEVPNVPTPSVLGYEADETIVGSPFFVMEKIDGEIPADVPNYNVSGWLTERSEASRRCLWENSVAVLAHLHQADPSRFSFLARPDRGVSGLEQDLRYWREHYDQSVGARRHPVLEAAWLWLVDNLPADSPTELAWGDARIPNLLYRGDDCVGLLDWDMVSLAGPESDLAWWLLMDLTNSKGSGVERLGGLGDGAEFLELWQKLTGRRPRNLRYQLAFAAFRLGAVLIRVVQQIDARGLLTPERARMAEQNYGTELLATMLGLPLAYPPQVVWADIPIATSLMARRPAAFSAIARARGTG